MLRDLCSGLENWPAIGMNIWGMTEQTPRPSEAARTVQMLCETDMAADIRAAMLMMVSTILRLDHMSAMGTMSSRPRA